MESPLLSEREVETAFVNYIHHAQDRMKVIGRQVRLPMGILDVMVLGHHRDGYHVMVAEIKRDVIDERACAQLLGYMGQVKEIAKHTIKRRDAFSPLNNHLSDDRVSGWLVGRSITQMAERMIVTLPLMFVEYSIQEHGVIEFRFGPHNRYMRWHRAMNQFDTPDAIKIAAAAMERNAKSRYLEEAVTFNSSYDFHESTTKGADCFPGLNPKNSLAMWERIPFDREAIEEN